VGQLGRVIKCMLALSLLHVALIAGAVLFGHLASAHDFYDEKCCYEQDCRPVNCNEIMSFGGNKGWSWRKVFFAADRLHLSRGALHEDVKAGPVPHNVSTGDVFQYCGRFTNSGSFAMLIAILRASSRVRRLAAARRPASFS
jgi:hypothetical protein